MKRRWISILLILLIVLGLFPVSAWAAELQRPDILALGDSITNGYGLANQNEERFSALLDPYYGNVVNRGVDGNTAPGILSQFTDAPFKGVPVTEDEVRNAEIITITCGGNDLMAVLYEKMVAKWNADNPSDPVRPDQITGIMGGTIDSSVSKRAGLIECALELLDSKNQEYLMRSAEFHRAMDDYITNLNKVTARIHEINPNAKILIATQYNPYVEFKNKEIDINLIIIRYYFNLHYLYTGMEDGTAQLNERIRDNAPIGNYTVAEIKNAFDRHIGGDLYLANYSSNISDISVDFHPSAEGHVVIAETLRSVIDSIPYTVTLHPLWDGTAIATETLGYGQYLSNSYNLSREGYCFRGWYTSSDGGHTFDSEIDLTQPITSDLTLYARWAEILPLGDTGLQITDDGWLQTAGLPEDTSYILIAGYNNQQMTECQYAAISPDLTEIEITVTGDTWKLFILDGNHVPLLPAVDLPS